MSLDLEFVFDQVGWSWGQIIRAREMELVRTDWWALSDVTLSTARRDYRQFLRDLPQNYSDPDDAAAAWEAYTIPE